MKEAEPGLLNREYTLPKEHRVRELAYSFSPAEKLLFMILLAVFIVSSFMIVARVNSESLVEIPVTGGSFSEGIVGSPRFINPLLPQQTDADRDLATLIYSGLMRANPDGTLRHDLAKSHTVSEDGLAYTITLRDNITFHDGEEITADDIVFTIQKVQEPNLKSPKRASWEGVLVEKVSDKEVLFTLDRPYSPFVENLTIGILPEHLWVDVPDEDFAFSVLNTEPIGSGPYKIKSVKKDESDVPLYYDLEAFEDFVFGTPFIESLRIKFYINENILIDSYINGEIDAINSISTNNLAYASLNVDEIRLNTVTLPRIFGVFFNQNQSPVLTNIEVRKALDVGLNKKRIVEEVLDGYGQVIEGPLPVGIIESTIEPDTSTTSIKKQAIDILERNGWEMDSEEGLWVKKTKAGTERLEFSISTSNVDELREAAEIIKEEWEQIGAKVTIRRSDTGELNANIIRPRKYDSLLFGEIVGRELDLFAFWHSSQRNDPGLNIALYANITVDALLEDARTETDRAVRLEKFAEFEKEIASDIPAVFIYSPDFIYIEPKKVQGIKLGTITTPSERFLNIHEWYIQTDRVWSFFVEG